MPWCWLRLSNLGALVLVQDFNRDAYALCVIDSIHRAADIYVADCGFDVVGDKTNAAFTVFVFGQLNGGCLAACLCVCVHRSCLSLLSVEMHVYLALN